MSTQCSAIDIDRTDDINKLSIEDNVVERDFQITKIISVGRTGKRDQN